MTPKSVIQFKARMKLVPLQIGVYQRMGSITMFYYFLSILFWKFDLIYLFDL